MNTIATTSRNLTRLVCYYNANRRRKAFVFRLKRDTGQCFPLVTSYARYMIEYMANTLNYEFKIDPKTKEITVTPKP